MTDTAATEVHALSYEPDVKYPHLVRVHCSCGWHTAGYVTRTVAESVFGARHLRAEQREECPW